MIEAVQCPFKSTDCNESIIQYPYKLVCMDAEFSKPGPPPQKKLALRGPFMLGPSQKSVSTNRFVKFSADRKIPKGIRRKLCYRPRGLHGFNKCVGFILCTLLPVTRIRFFNDIYIYILEMPKKNLLLAKIHQSKNTEIPKMVKHFTWNCRFLWVHGRLNHRNL